MVRGSAGPLVAQPAGYYSHGVASSEGKVDYVGFVDNVSEVGEGSQDVAYCVAVVLRILNQGVDMLFVVSDVVVNPGIGGEFGVPAVVMAVKVPQH